MSRIFYFNEDPTFVGASVHVDLKHYRPRPYPCISMIPGNEIPDEIPPKIVFSERKVNSNLKNGIPEILGEIPLLSGGIPLLSGGIPDFLVENVIFWLQMLQTYEELNNLIEYFFVSIVYCNVQCILNILHTNYS